MHLTHVDYKAKLEWQNVLTDYDAQLEAFILADYNYYDKNNYINFSINYIADEAPEAQLEAHSPDKRGLSGRLGSIPGWGDSAPFLFIFYTEAKPQFLNCGYAAVFLCLPNFQTNLGLQSEVHAEVGDFIVMPILATAKY
mgnify:CR=1 FL=1